MVMIRCPQKAWEFQHFLSSKDGDPTKLFLIVCRIFGLFAICFEFERSGVLLKNLQAGGFLFVGGAILMTSEVAGWIPVVGSVCALLGGGMLIYYLFSKNGKY